jgi:hypothetical protein
MRFSHLCFSLEEIAPDLYSYLDEFVARVSVGCDQATTTHVQQSNESITPLRVQDKADPIFAVAAFTPFS